MSEPIQSIAQNNYILATQQEVSHDNSLSGNGTVDSPLGVVPGYNETVLWEGTETLSTNPEITLSELSTNFERIRVYGESWNNWCPKLWGEILMTTRSTGNYQTSLSTSYLGAAGAAIRFAQANFTFNGNKVNVSLAGLFSIQGTSVSTGSPSNTVITKIVGINRIANN